ncbi:MAG: hypothetical protein KDI01_12180 [Halioglobus sp.]|nr:hypothetical protein [Halioglobus sp.]
MSEKIIIAVVFAALGLVAGHQAGHWHAGHEEHEMEEEMDMSMEADQSSESKTDMSAEMAQAMNPEGLPMGIHNHPMREIDRALPIPTVSLAVEPDKMDGFNLEVLTENFTFAPERVNTDAVANEGHAHIYVNGTKIARLYGPWFNLSGKYLEDGINTIEVTLNANDHSEWAIDGAHIQTTVKLDKANGGSSAKMNMEDMNM